MSVVVFANRYEDEARHWWHLADLCSGDPAVLRGLTEAHYAYVRYLQFGNRSDRAVAYACLYVGTGQRVRFCRSLAAA